MVGERADTLPEELESWLQRRTEGSDETREDVLTRAVSLFQFLEEHDDEFDAENATAFARVDSLVEQVESLEDHLDRNVDDLRERIIEVLRAAESKAPVDHDHADLHRRLAELEENQPAGGHPEDLTDVREDLADLERTVGGGFDNYERILEALTDRSDDARAKLNALGRAVTNLRERVGQLEIDRARRAAADDIAWTANRHGIALANCGDCGSSVQIALLSEPRCPHCDCIFGQVDPAPRFFGSPTLTVADRPALESPPESEDTFEWVLDERDGGEDPGSDPDGGP